MKEKRIAYKNPIIPSEGVCDPHLRAYGGRVYLYASHDFSKDNKGYRMDDWHIWSSPDFVEWTLEKVIRPEDTFVGKSPHCWATDGIERNGKYYFYFSVGSDMTGVLVSDSPDGDYKDVLKKPLVGGGALREYDPAVFIDDDGSPYIVFGAPAWAYGGDNGYFIARLNEDMVSLAEKPRRIAVNHPADDKAALHKYNGKYYLTWASFYAVSDNVYGPYIFTGNVGVSSDHGSYLFWEGQWFKSFTIQDPSDNFRSTGICYVHYRDNGEMACDQMIEEYGVGRYDGDWNKIQAEWYLKGKEIEKKENDLGSFSASPKAHGAYLCYPKVRNLKGKNRVCLFAVADTGGTVEIRRGGEDGKLLAECVIPPSAFYDYRGYRPYLFEMEKTDDETDICIVFKEYKGRIALSWFRFYKG